MCVFFYIGVSASPTRNEKNGERKIFDKPHFHAMFYSSFSLEFLKKMPRLSEAAKLIRKYHTIKLHILTGVQVNRERISVFREQIDYAMSRSDFEKMDGRNEVKRIRDSLDRWSNALEAYYEVITGDKPDKPTKPKTKAKPLSEL